jgi:hypothetical protein
MKSGALDPTWPHAVPEGLVPSTSIAPRTVAICLALGLSEYPPMLWLKERLGPTSLFLPQVDRVSLHTTLLGVGRVVTQ